MDPTGEFETNYEPGEVLEIANAIVTRELDQIEFERVAKGGEVSTSDVLPHRQKLQKSATARAALYIRRIENPDIVISADDYIEASFEDLYAEMAAALSDGGAGEVSRDDMKQLFLEHYAQFIESSGQTPEQQTEDFKTLFEAAKAMAAIHGVPVAQVYKSDELFAEAHRTAYTIEEFALRYVKFIDGIAKAVTASTARRILDRDLSPEVRANLDEDEVSTRLAEILLGDEIRQVSQSGIDRLQRDERMIITANIRRFWGEEALNNLPDEIKQKLGIY